jgi:hypothetical protein
MSLQGNKNLGEGNSYVIMAVVTLLVIVAVVSGLGYLIVHFLF